MADSVHAKHLCPQIAIQARFCRILGAAVLIVPFLELLIAGKLVVAEKVQAVATEAPQQIAVHDGGNVGKVGNDLTDQSLALGCAVLALRHSARQLFHGVDGVADGVLTVPAMAGQAVFALSGKLFNKIQKIMRSAVHAGSLPVTEARQCIRSVCRGKIDGLSREFVNGVKL